MFKIKEIAPWSAAATWRSSFAERSPFFRIYRDSILTDALAGFVNLEQRAKAVSHAAFKRFAARPGTDDAGDMSQEAEWAQEEGQAYYEAMVGLRQAMINLLTAGLFHLLEQQLAKRSFDCKFRDIPLDPQKANLGPKGSLLSWYEKHFDLDLKKLTQWNAIDELRLVAGAVKHADGGSARELRGKREELFRSRTLNEMNLPAPDYERWPLRSPLTGEDLFVTEQIFAEYANSAHDFMEAIVDHFQQNAGKGYPSG
jgi:hypothetical protein